MKKYYSYIGVSLLLSLFIYLFYRTEKTMVNEIFIAVISKSNYLAIKQFVNINLPLPAVIINSLPEGLWVFAVTLASKGLYLSVSGKKNALVYCPLVFAIVLEFLQLLHVTNGRFDYYDLLSSVVFWIFGYFVIRTPYEIANIFRPFTFRGLFCIITYLIVYLAHVFY